MYPALRTLDQPWNPSSAELALEVLTEYRPGRVSRHFARPDQPLTSSSVIAFARDTIRDARVANAELAVVYYVGHTLVGPGGRLGLLQGTATRDDIHRFSSEAGHPAHDDDEPILLLETLFGTLASEDVPFVLLVDGCLDHAPIQNELRQLGFTYDPRRPGSIVYHGPRDVLGPRDLDPIMAQQERIPNAEPWLRGNNPVVFAVRPGTYALGEDNPFVIGGPPVAPLASSLHRWRQLLLMRNGTLPSLAALVDKVAGWRGMGEIGLAGAITWSDFGTLDSILQRVRPEGYRTERSAEGAIVDHLQPRLGTIEDLARDREGSWILQIKTVEPSGMNRWALWHWSGAAGAQPLVTNVLFPRIAWADGATYLYSEDPVKLDRIGLDTRREVKTGDIELRGLVAGFGAGSVIVTDADNVVDSGGDRVVRIRSVEVDAVLAEGEFTEARSVTEPVQGTLAWLDDGHPGTIVVQPTSQPTYEISTGDAVLAALAVAGRDLVAVSMDRTKLYRMPLSGPAQVAFLLDDEDRQLVSFDLGYGGLVADHDRAWLASGDEIVAFDLNNLDWRQVGRTE